MHRQGWFGMTVDERRKALVEGEARRKASFARMRQRLREAESSLSADARQLAMGATRARTYRSLDAAVAGGAITAERAARIKAALERRRSQNRGREHAARFLGAPAGGRETEGPEVREWRR